MYTYGISFDKKFLKRRFGKLKRRVTGIKRRVMNKA